MLLIVGVVICIAAAISAPINNTNTSYILAKVLFYKNAKGQIVVANGPVPSIANLAIRDDIFSRIEDISVNRVKVVSIYNESKGIPKSVNIYQLIKNEEKPVFVTEVKKRLTRTIIKDWWDKLWGHKRKKIARIKKKMKVNYMVTPSPDSNNTRMVKDSTTTKKDGKGMQEHNKKKETCSHCTKELLGKTKSNKFVKVTDSPQAELLNSLEAYDDYVPNDIYYSVEKRCVNWSDICDVQTGGLLNMSTSNFNYFKRPIFTQNGPLME
ncbi:unnamed protein product [Arctia plantaginis]|uniref:Uncharacterized protein n=1 Tax=Arctia plantaginis TaxID=874455 RepID=A0A8S1BIX2_ARCPL|nr:unnamed protein product [Arctia plantaginis]